MKKYFLFTLFILAVFLITLPLKAQMHISIISDIVLEGNELIADQKILELIEIKIGDLFDEEKIKSDLQAIFDLGYFLDVSASLQPYQGGIRVIYELLEYPLITDIVIEGNKSYSDQELLNLIDLKENEILNINNLNEGRIAIETMYRENGYILATFIDINISNDGILRLEINEGYINEIIIKGNEKTKDYVIKRELEFSEGDVVNIEKMQSSFQKIVYLNIFDEFNPKLELVSREENMYNIVIDISEGKTGEYGALELKRWFYRKYIY